jgi:tRNA threonylcarbamoyladenosine biosynthesis protein TsaB
MKLLAIDTAAEACSAALLLDGELRERFTVQPRRHGALILEMMDTLLMEAGLRPADLDGLAFGRGPGAFTGVRIAVGVAQGVAFGAELPLVPVSTLAALAQGEFHRSGARRLLPAFDARMDELYWGVYEIGAAGLAVPRIPEQVASADRVPLPEDGGWLGLGSGWAAQGERLAARLGPRLAGSDPACCCHAADIARLGAAALRQGGGVTPAAGLPVYLRDRVTWTDAPGGGVRQD